MTETLKKEIKLLMWKINPLRLNYSVDKLFKKTSMYDILKKYKVSKEFLRHYIDIRYIAGPDWNPVHLQKLSEQFMRDFKDRLEWMWVCIHQNLTESFMREMKDYVKWSYAAENQKMSPDFILEFSHRLNYYCLIKSRHKDMKVLPENLIYDLSLIIDKNVFNDTFIKNKKITRKRLNELMYINKVNRFEILDIR